MRGQIGRFQSRLVAERAHVPVRAGLVYGRIVERGLQQRVLRFLGVLHHYLARYAVHLTRGRQGMRHGIHMPEFSFHIGFVHIVLPSLRRGEIVRWYLWYKAMLYK